MTLARVKVFPDPVTPRRVWWGEPERMDFFRFKMAAGWSPAGLNDALTLKGCMLFLSLNSG